MKNNPFPHMFSPIGLGSMRIKNRLVRSGTLEGLADPETGDIDQEYIDLHAALAAGGVGLIITGLTFCHTDVRPALCADFASDERIRPFAEFVQKVRESGENVKIAMQIGHIGRQVLAWEPGQDIVAPSAVLEMHTQRMPRALSTGEIRELVNSMAQAVLRARKAGFDAVQLHAAHGWLLSSFLSPHTNRRTDEYGGSTENRARIISEIISQGHDLAGDDFPILLKMNGSDYIHGGLELPEAIELCGIFQRDGAAGIEISSCMWESINANPEDLDWKIDKLPEARKGIRTRQDEAYHRAFASAIKKELPEFPIMLVGGLRSPSLMEEILVAGDADMLSLSRPLIRDPGLPGHWENGDTEKAACVSCNSCVAALKNGGTACVVKGDSV